MVNTVALWCFECYSVSLSAVILGVFSLNKDTQKHGAGELLPTKQILVNKLQLFSLGWFLYYYYFYLFFQQGYIKLTKDDSKDFNTVIKKMYISKFRSVNAALLNFLDIKE